VSTAFSGAVSRGEVLAQARQLLESLVREIPPAHRPEFTEEVLASWDARFRAASEVVPAYLLPDDVRESFREIADSLDRVLPETVIEWIDLIGQNVLAMVDIQPVAVVSAASSKRTCGPSNDRVANDWSLGEQRALALVA
jgi:hypothetical protein